MYLTSDLEIYSASYGLDSALLCEQPTFELKSRVCAGRGLLAAMYQQKLWLGNIEHGTQGVVVRSWLED